MAVPVVKPYPRIIMTSASNTDPAAPAAAETAAGSAGNAGLASRPIGVFDSGVGGLTVARSIIDQLPNESILYVGDTAHGPYGPLPIAEVRANALGVMDELVDSGVKLLTIACNSASAAVLRDARERYTARYGIPVIEVIQPAVRRAVAATRTGRVGVIGTSATVGSRAYEDTFAAAPDLEIKSTIDGSILWSGPVPLTDSAGGLPYGAIPIPGRPYGLELLLHRSDAGVGTLVAEPYAVNGTLPDGTPSIVRGFPVAVLNGETKSMEGLDLSLSLRGFSQYTLLIAKRDPGQGIVWVAFAALIAGITITFYRPRRRVWTRLTQDGRLGIVWRSDRYVDVEREFGRLLDQLVAARHG